MDELREKVEANRKARQHDYGPIDEEGRLPPALMAIIDAAPRYDESTAKVLPRKRRAPAAWRMDGDALQIHPSVMGASNCSVTSTPVFSFIAPLEA